jgi:uncharacterized membrane protein YidH (DUF202 family)
LSGVICFEAKLYGIKSKKSYIIGRETLLWIMYMGSGDGRDDFFFRTQTPAEKRISDIENQRAREVQSDFKKKRTVLAVFIVLSSILVIYGAYRLYNPHILWALLATVAGGAHMLRRTLLLQTERKKPKTKWENVLWTLGLCLLLGMAVFIVLAMKYIYSVLPA